MQKIKFIVIPVVFCIQTAFAQTTFDRVYSIIQTNCSQTCHSYGSPDGNLLMDGTKEAVLANLVGVTPDNAHAAMKGFKRVMPGDARRSLLFRKVSQGLDTHITLHEDEGDPMPKDTLPLSNVERELIRQWIIFGARDTVYPYADEQTIIDYYGGQAAPRDPSLAIPDSSEGYQIYYGPIFLRPGDEIEFDCKFPLYNDIDLEVYKMEAAVNRESHHMALYKYKPGQDTLMADGLRQVKGVLDASALFYLAEPIGQWPNSLEVETPQGTALMWDAGTVLNISYHILNYNTTGIIACEVYFNVHARPRQESTIPMLSYPVRYDGLPVYGGGWEVGNLILFPNDPGDSTTLTITQYGQPDTSTWYLWSLQAHTHQLGADYNVWLRNPNGTKGTQIYDGTFDPEHTYDRGYYDWEHPPLRVFPDLLPVDMSVGLIHEATFYNDTPDTIGFGLKTTDEMYVTYIFYTKDMPTGIAPRNTPTEARISIYPNPAANEAVISIGTDKALKNAEFRVFDMVGKEVASADNLTNPQFTMDFSLLPSGNYFYRFMNNGQVAGTGKMAVAR